MITLGSERVNLLQNDNLLLTITWQVICAFLHSDATEIVNNSEWKKRKSELSLCPNVRAFRLLSFGHEECLGLFHSQVYTSL